MLYKVISEREISDMKKKTIGIILLVIGILAVIGGIANGTYANIGDMNPITAATVIILEAGMIIGGTVLIIKGKEGA